MPKVTRKNHTSTDLQVRQFVTWFNEQADNPLVLKLDQKGGRWLGKRKRAIFQSDPRPSWVGYMEISDGEIKLYLHENYFDDNIGSLYQVVTRYEDNYRSLPVEIVEL